jgi:hypothetical protein
MSSSASSNSHSEYMPSDPPAPPEVQPEEIDILTRGSCHVFGFAIGH